MYAEIEVIVAPPKLAIAAIVFSADPVLETPTETWQTSETCCKQNFVTYRNHVMVVKFHISIAYVLCKNHVMATSMCHHTAFVYAMIEVIFARHKFAIAETVFATDPDWGNPSATWQKSEMWLKQGFVTYRPIREPRENKYCIVFCTDPVMGQRANDTSMNWQTSET